MRENHWTSMVSLAAALGAAIFLSGCVTKAVISDLESDKVIVQATGNDMAIIMAEARRGCSMHGRVPQEVSYRCLDNYCVQKEYLFACK